jgi:hypothetical protein
VLKHTLKPPDIREAALDAVEPGDIIGGRIKYLVTEKKHIPFQCKASWQSTPWKHAIMGVYCLYGTELHLLGSKEPSLILQRGYSREAEAHLPPGWFVWKSPGRAA